MPEVPPRTASVAADLNHYKWRDADWLDSRRDLQALDRPMSFYEVHLGSCSCRADDPSRWLSYRDSAEHRPARQETRTSSCCR